MPEQVDGAEVGERLHHGQRRTGRQRRASQGDRDAPHRLPVALPEAPRRFEGLTGLAEERTAAQHVDVRVEDGGEDHGRAQRASAARGSAGPRRAGSSAAGWRRRTARGRRRPGRRPAWPSAARAPSPASAGRGSRRRTPAPPGPPPTTRVPAPTPTPRSRLLTRARGSRVRAMSSKASTPPMKLAGSAISGPTTTSAITALTIDHAGTRRRRVGAATAVAAAVSANRRRASARPRRRSGGPPRWRRSGPSSPRPTRRCGRGAAPPGWPRTRCPP